MVRCTACAPGSCHATQERKDTPTSPRPSPPLIHFPQAPGARSASLAFAPCGAQGRIPPPPSRAEGEVGLLFARCFATTCAILPACATLLLRPRPHMPRPRPFRRGRLGLARLRRGRLCPRRIPLIPLNPTKSRFEFEFCPRWDEEPDRDRGKICGLVPCSRSFYPCARRPRHVMDGQPGLVPGIRPSMCLPSVRRARLLEMPGTSPGMTACGGGRSERPRTGPTTCKRASETGC